MAGNFPSSMPSFTDPQSNDSQRDVSHAAQHQNINAEVSAIANTLGVNPQGGSSTVEARLSTMSATDATLSNAISTVSNALSAEIVNRISGDDALSVRIDGLSTGGSALSEKVSVEIVNRISADNALSNAISVVSQALSVTNAALSVASVALSNELSVRANADSVLSNAISTVSQALSVETVNRVSADDSLSNAISAVSNNLSVLSTNYTSLMNRVSANSGGVGIVSIARGTFTSASLSAGRLLLTHSKDLTAPFSLLLEIFDNNANKIIPDAVSGATNTVDISLSSYSTMSGTWGYAYLA